MIVALRRLTILALAVIFVLIAAVFAYGNQDPIALDIGIMRLEQVSLTVALAITFVLGAAFGGLFALIAMLKNARERSALKKELRRTEAELNALRNLPRIDAG